VGVLVVERGRLGDGAVDVRRERPAEIRGVCEEGVTGIILGVDRNFGEHLLLRASENTRER